MTYKKVKCLKVEPRKVFWKLQLSTGNVPPHGPAQNGEAAIPRPHVDRHLAKIVQAELGGGSHLQVALITVIRQHPLGDLITGNSGKSTLTCRAPSKKGSIRGHMLTLSVSMSTEEDVEVRHMMD